jgi:small nuclear ribonucleoprotein B and B'
MNLVLADTEEFRRVKRKAPKSTAAPGAASTSAPLVETEEKRTLGLTIIRGAHIISLSVESPPPAEPSARLGVSAPGGATAAMAAGPGIARPAGRGLPVGLTVSSLGILHMAIADLRYRVQLLVWAEHRHHLEVSEVRHLLLAEVCILIQSCRNRY